MDAWREQSRRLHETFDAVLEEPLPARLTEPLRAGPPRGALRIAAALGWLALGGVIGFALRTAPPSVPAASLAHSAALAHAVFTPEVRHPVEVAAAEEQHLVGWLSKRLGERVRAPHLSGQGYDLVGGRLLAGEAGPVAQFMYQDARGRRLTLYARRDGAEGAPTAFHFAQEGRIAVFYWLDGRLGYALSGEIEKSELLGIAQEVYRQLER
ncbi:MAG: anti-sigma factor [Rhodocyclaceae bacterium]